MANPSSMAIGIVVTLVLLVVAMLNRRKNPFFPEPHRVEPHPHVRSWLRSHHRPRQTPVGVAYHQALHARH